MPQITRLDDHVNGQEAQSKFMNTSTSEDNPPDSRKKEKIAKLIGYGSIPKQI
jgi:hypothetical protein